MRGRENWVKSLVVILASNMPPYPKSEFTLEKKMGNPVFLTGLPLQKPWRETELPD
jgi:hypothetical protein